MKFSIIVPVYNTAKYLPECIESILSQENVDFECLLIDDGSTDGKSSELCDEFASKDMRVKAFHIPNSGVAEARNFGIRKSSTDSDYLIFIDSDDFLISDRALESIEHLLMESYADVLIYNFKEYDSKGLEDKSNNFNRESIKGVTYNEVLNNLISSGRVTHLIWDKVIKRQIVIENELFFLKVERLEDSELFGRVIKYAKSYDYCEEFLYAYRKRKGSMTTEAITISKINDYQEIFNRVDIEGEEIADKLSRRNFYSYSAYPYLAALGISEFFFDKKKIKKENRKIRDFSYILKYSDDPRVKNVSLVYRIFGKKVTTFLLKVAAKHRNFIVK